MEIGRHIRRQAKDILAPVIGLGLSCYFGYHLVEGDRGLTSWIRLTQQIREAKATAAAVHAEKETAEARAALLRPDHLDRDMLDEQSRAALNLVEPGEVVILNGDPPK